ncbi:hypothetical protein GH714_033020 [Hevea brasiliensis]|uniref:RNase H type-1 domain-containing protein n=1 Tax=Hevea brasiliensis TaxID=3981 RepID=A0A6A6LL45_HEVBR|nr:hypothetical protein GH714_033020 [Hevea brasiliensis]
MAEEEVPGGVPLYYAEFWVRVYDLPSDLITQSTGFGFVLRDENGMFVIAGSGWHPGLRPPKFAEAVALRHTLQWLSVQQYSNVQLEIDSKEVLFGVMSAEEDFLEWGLIMADCK